MADSNEVHSSTATARKPYVRMITEKRREQNRTSQKKYRERLRKRLEELEEQVASTTTDGDIRQPTATRTVKNAPDDLDEVQTPAKEPGGDANVEIRPPPLINDSRINFGDIFQAAGDIGLPQGFASQTNTFQVSFLANQHARSPRPLLDAPTVCPSPAADTNTSLLTALDLMPKPDPDSIDMREFWPVPAEAYRAPYTPPPPPPQSASSRASSIFPSRFSVGINQYPSVGSNPDTSPSSLPDPYLNHLSLNGEAWMGASLAIAASLGISRSAYVNDHPSLFYHSNERTFYHLPKTLRPTPAQLTLPHPVYLDCIIFPAFRTRAIIKSARGELDHGALIMDLINDGLVCWGNTEATAGNGRGMRDGVAWSIRSWEARCWFLKRWEALVGRDGDEEGIDELRDEDGIWENSRWWWTLRGEIMW